MTISPAPVLIVIALVLVLVDLIQTKGRTSAPGAVAYTKWAVLALACALLAPLVL